MQNFVTFRVILRKKFNGKYFINYRSVYVNG